MTDQFLAANRAAADVLLGLAQAQFTACERLSRLAFDTAKSALQEGAAYADSAAHAHDARELMNLSAGLARPVMGRTIAFAREASDVGVQWQSEVSQVMQSRSGEFSRMASSMLDTLTKNAPGGSDAAAAAMKSALAAASSAYDSFDRFSKQATEFVTANLNAAGEAAKQSKAA